MKTFYKVASIVVLSMFCLMSCDNEPLSEDITLNDPSVLGGVDVSAENILGIWELTDQNIDITQSLSAELEGQAIEQTQEINISQQSGDITITFSEDGQYTSTGSATLVVTGEQNGTPIPQTTETGTNNFASGTWSISDGTLTLVTGQNEVTYTITSFSGTNLNLFTNEELPSFDAFIESGAIPDITDVPGFEDFPDFNFDVEQAFEGEFSLTKIE